MAAVSEGNYDRASAGAEATAAKMPTLDLKFKFGASSPERTLDQAGREIDTPGKEKETSDELDKLRPSFKEFLSGHLQQLIRNEQTMSREDFARLYGEHGEHITDKLVFDELTTLGQEGAGVRGRHIDKDLLEAFIQTDRGMGIARALLRQQFDLEAPADAVYIALTPEGPAPETLGSGPIPLQRPGGEAGILRRAQQSVIRTLNRPVRLIGGRPNPAQGGWHHPATVREAIRDISRIAALQGAAGGGIGTAIGTIIGGTRGGDIGAAIGAGVGVAATPIEIMISRGMRPGEELNITECVRAFQTLAGGGEDITVDAAGNVHVVAHGPAPNEAEKRWLKATVGFDIDDFEEVDGEVQIKAGRSPETLMSRPDRLARLAGHAKMLVDFQDAIDVRREQQSVSPLSRLYRDAGENIGDEFFRQNGEDLDSRVMRHFNVNRGGEQDMDGNNREIQDPASGRWVVNPNFDENNLDYHGNAQRYREAYRRALREEIELAFKEIRDGKIDYRSELLKDLAAAEASGTAGSEANRANIARIRGLLGTEEKPGVIKQDETELEALSGTLTGFRTTLEQLDDKELQQRTFQGRFRTPGVGVIPPADIPARIRQVITYSGAAAGAPQIEIDGETIRSLRVREQEIEDEIEAHLRTWRGQPGNARPTAPTTAMPIDPRAAGGTITKAEVDLYNIQLAAYTQQQADYKNNVDVYNAREDGERNRLRELAHYKGRYEDIATDKTRLQELLTRAGAIEEELTQLRENLAGRRSDNEVRNKTEKTLREMREALTNPLLGTLTPANLQTETMEQLLERLNNGYAAGPPPVGWQAAENNNPENRKLLLQAMAEARLTPVAGTPLQAALDPTVWGMSEYDFLVLDTQQIRDRMTQRVLTPPAGLPALPPVPNPGMVNNMRALARSRFEERQTAIGQLEWGRAGEEKRLQRELSGLETAGVNPDLRAMRRYITRYGEIGKAISLMDMREFLSTQRVNRTAGNADEKAYKQFENGQKKAYVLMTELMFACRSDAEAKDGNLGGSEAARQIAQRVVSEKDLARQLKEHFGLAGNTFNQTVNELRTRYENGYLTEEDLRYFFTEVMIYGEDRDTDIGRNTGFIRDQVRAAA